MKSFSLLGAMLIALLAISPFTTSFSGMPLVGYASAQEASVQLPEVEVSVEESAPAEASEESKEIIVDGISLPGSVEESADWENIVVSVLSNPKNLKAGSIGLVLVLLIVQLAKLQLVGGWFKKLSPKKQAGFITCLGLVYSLIAQLSIKTGGWAVAVVAFISSGGAVSAWNLYKLMTEKEKSLSATV